MGRNVFGLASELGVIGFRGDEIEEHADLFG
jgi:hypothetical protein